MTNVNINPQEINEYLREAGRILASQTRREELWAPEEGENIIRILPRPGTIKFWTTMGWHYGVGIVGSQAYVCPYVTLGQPCPICEMSAELHASEDEADEEVARQLYVKTKYVMNIIDRKTNSVKLFTASRKLFSLILRHYKPGLLDLQVLSGLKLSSVACDFTDLQNGKDIIIERISTGKMAYEVSYSVILGQQSSVDQALLRHLIDPLAIFPIYGYEDLKRIMLKEAVDLTKAKILNIDKILSYSATQTQESSEPTSTEMERTTITSNQQEIVQHPTPKVISHPEPVQPSAVPPTRKTPKCFGIEYEEHDLQCKQCEYKELCIVEFKKNNPAYATSSEATPSAEVGAGNGLSPEERIRKALERRKK
jgi:hypothetical protein